MWGWRSPCCPNHVLLRQRTHILFPAPTGQLTTSSTPAPALEPLSSSGCCTHMHIPTHMHKMKSITQLRNKAPKYSIVLSVWNPRTRTHRQMAPQALLAGPPSSTEVLQVEVRDCLKKTRRVALRHKVDLLSAHEHTSAHTWAVSLPQFPTLE